MFNFNIKLPPVAFVSFSGEDEYFQPSCGDYEKSIGVEKKTSNREKCNIFRTETSHRRWVEGLMSRRDNGNDNERWICRGGF